MPFSDNDKQKIICKSNELIEARYSLTLGEQRLILLLASEISPKDDDFKSYEIRVSDFAKMFGLEASNSLYEKVQNAADSLVGKTLQLSSDVKISRTTAWLSYVEYIRGSGLIKLEFHNSLKPYLLQLKSHFTQFVFNYVIDFKSQYSMRLYELLKMDSFKIKNGQFEKTFEVSELRLILGIAKKDYPLFANFKQKAINPAISEISDKTDLSINDVRYGKTGRKVTNITFVVGVRSKNETNLRQANLRIEDIRPEKESENHPVIDSLVSLGFSLEIAKRYKNKHGIKKIERNIAYTLAKKQAGLVKDVPSYLNMAIEHDYGGVWDIKHKKEVEAQKQKDGLEQEKIMKQEKIKQDNKEKYQKAFEMFQSLLDDQQESIKNEFFEQTNSFIVGHVREMQKKGKDIFASPLILPSFKKFLIEEKGFGSE